MKQLRLAMKPTNQMCGLQAVLPSVGKRERRQWYMYMFMFTFDRDLVRLFRWCE